MNKITFFSIWLFSFIVTAQTVQPKDNLIINGGMNLAQRNFTSSVTLSTSYQYTVDRFGGRSSGSQVVTQSKDSTIPTGSIAANSYLLTATTANASPGAGDFVTTTYHVEGYDLRKFKDRYVTLSFKVRAAQTGTYCIGLQNSASNRAYIMNYTINAANTFEKKSLTFKHDSSGTWLYTNGVGMRIIWTSLHGSNFQTATASNTWYTPSGTEYLANASCASGNMFQAVSDNMFLSEVMLTEGSQSQNFVNYGRTFSDEVQAAQRYYYKTYDLNTNHGGAGSTSANYWFSNGLSASALALRATVNFPVRMRAAPSSNVFSNVTGAANNAACPSGDNSAGFIQNAEDSATVEITEIAASGDKRCSFEITADAEFY